MGEGHEGTHGAWVVPVALVLCLEIVSVSSDRLVRAQQPAAAPDAVMLLDRYAGGAHEAVAREMAAVRDFEALRKQLEKVVPGWITSAGADETRRRALVAGTLLLEVVHAGLQTDWGQLKLLIEVGCRLLRTHSVPAEAERLWMLSSIALGQGARDATFLIGGGPAVPREHLNHARSRVPDEPRLRLAAAVAEEFRAGSEPPRSVTRVSPLVDQTEAVRKRETIRHFLKLAEAPSLTAEAELHAGYLWLQHGNRREALNHLRIASERSTDPYVTYLAHFFTGRVLLAEKQVALAEAAFRQALATLPGTQSASEALAALLFVDGRRDEAYQLIETSFSHRPLPPDPWRLYGYGDFRRWPDLVRQLREAIR